MAQPTPEAATAAVQAHHDDTVRRMEAQQIGKCVGEVRRATQSDVLNVGGAGGAGGFMVLVHGMTVSHHAIFRDPLWITYPQARRVTGGLSEAGVLMGA